MFSGVAIKPFAYKMMSKVCNDPGLSGVENCKAWNRDIDQNNKNYNAYNNQLADFSKKSGNGLPGRVRNLTQKKFYDHLNALPKHDVSSDIFKIAKAQADKEVDYYHRTKQVGFVSFATLQGISLFKIRTPRLYYRLAFFSAAASLAAMGFQHIWGQSKNIPEALKKASDSQRDDSNDEISKKYMS